MSQSIIFETTLTKCHLRALQFENPFLFVGQYSMTQLIYFELHTKRVIKEKFKKCLIITL